jgi:hypothetical protein
MHLHHQGPLHQRDTTTTAEFVSPRPDVNEHLDANADDVKPHHCNIDNILGPTAASGLVTHQVAAALHLHIVYELASFAKVEQHHPWRRAMLEEIESIESNKTW